ncbi:hypothetical protein HWI79_2847 [Cryptosporidium felis]|nr:hypothetical protein HWI79_2847 [Cryptosporidium felis]
MKKPGLLRSVVALIGLHAVTLRGEITGFESTESSLADSQSIHEASVFESSLETQDLERMRSLQDFIKYMVDEILFPIEGIVKGYCLYRSALDETKESSFAFNKESIAIATILLSGSWKNPIGFVSRCRNGLRKISNGIRATHLESFNHHWSSARRIRRSMKASRIKICFKARICSRMMKRLDGMENLRSFLLSRTRYGLIFPSQGAEMSVWNTVREFKDVLSAGLLKGEVQNHIRVLIMFNFMNKVLEQIGKEPASLFVCIALINAMVREKSLNDWLLGSDHARSSNGRVNNFEVDPITALRYDPHLTIKQNISKFQIGTCNHVIWSSGLIYTARQIQAIGENSHQISLARRKISWMCAKMFSL